MRKEETKIKKPLPQIFVIVSVVVLIVLSSYLIINKLDDKTGDNKEESQQNEAMVESNGDVIVTFEDENLENYIREELGIPSEDITSK